MSTNRVSMVEVCVFSLTADRPSYLLLRRSETEKLYPGLWQYITGSIEPGETAVEAALRELREETGFEAKRFWIVPFVNSLYVRESDIVEMLPVFCAQVDAGLTPQLSAEHSVYEWLPYREAHNRLIWPGQRQGLAIVHEYIVAGQKAADFGKIR